jgi:uncharacterized protein (DUF2126 family)
VQALTSIWSILRPRAIGGCTYHVNSRRAQLRYFPVNANEGSAARGTLLAARAHRGPLTLKAEPINPATPTTLDLRWQPD